MRLIYGILAALFIYLAAALVLSLIPTHPSPSSCSSTIPIYITSNGIHLDIILPASHIKQPLRAHLQTPQGTRFVSFGWGDKAFYIQTPEWSDLTFPVAFRAVFLKSETAMHVTFYQHSFSSWHKLELCPEQLEELNRYIENSFQQTPDGKIKKMAFEGYSKNDVFFEAKGSFSLFNTCNVWTNRGLKKSGVKTSLWSPFDFGVLYHLSRP